MTGIRRHPGTHWRRAPIQFATDAHTLRRLLAGLVHRRADRPQASAPTQGSIPAQTPSPVAPNATGQEAGSAGSDRESVRDGQHSQHARNAQAARDTRDTRDTRDAPDDARPIDFVTISQTVSAALELRPVLPERAWVDTTTLQLRGHLELLLRDYDADTDTNTATHAQECLALHRDAYRLLTLCRSWNEARMTTPPLHAYELMRALAVTTRDFAVFLPRQQTPPTHPRTQGPPP
ncbi:hypothetical protein [Streptomyces sp. NBC_01429]|uniref:hypothetical protein n=1 Tax=Streptomyces sp. NBC_01429 TaxID=2903862 RepID=UPI002E27C6BA|nr:hypothetical protein [Streptomyces sp. NBC_01429]